MERKMILPVFLCLAFAFVYISPGTARPQGDVDKAKELINADMVPQAIELLKKSINEMPSDAEAHFLIGTCYLKQREYDNAEDRFADAVSLEPGYKNEIGREYEQAADDASKNSSPLTAGNLFEQAVKYDPRIEKNAYYFFVKLGDAKGGAPAIPFYDKALTYTNDKNHQKQIGYRFLDIAERLSPGSQSEYLKNRAVALLGREKVHELSSKPFWKTIFKQTYTDSDIDPKTGNIVAFTWDDRFKKGDYVEISGFIPKGAPEISIYLGENFSPEWKTTENGNISYSIENVPPAGSYYLIKSEKNIIFTLKISRKITP